MWRYLLLFLIQSHCLLILCQASSDCQIPTEEERKEVSLCSYCSDSHAGVRLAVHPSVEDKYPLGPYVLDINFHCNNTQNMININQDDCFNVRGFILTSLQNPSVWRWLILGQRLPQGTKCLFTANIENAFPIHYHQLSTSCIIGSDESLVMPATCSELTEQSCPCQCSNGFTTSNDVDDTLTCTNIDECSESSHNCINESNCVDTEGGHYCMNETTMAPSTTTVDASNMEITGSSTVAPSTTIADMETSSVATTYSSTDTDGISVIISTAFTTEPSSSRAPNRTPWPSSIEITTTPRLVVPNDTILAITLGIVLLLMLATVVVMISISIIRKNLYLRRNKLKFMTIPREFAIDPFDPDFCPVDIEKIDSVSVATISLKSVFEPLRDPQDGIPSASGSLITLNLSELD